MSDLIEHRLPAPLHRLRGELDRLFSNGLPSLWGEENGSRMWMPRLDFFETEKEYLAQMDLPGMDKEDIQVTIENHQLIVSGERNEEKSDENKNYHRMERSHGSFYRSIPLPDNVKADAIDAEVKNGVLMVHIPKSKNRKAKTIKIK